MQLSKVAVDGLSFQLPLSDRQEVAWRGLEIETAIASRLAGSLNETLVNDMDRRRIRDTRELARDIAELRCAAFRTILVEEEQRKPRA